MLRNFLPKNFKLPKQIILHGNIFLNLSFYSYVFIIWVSIICWVIYNDGYYQIDDLMLSTVLIKTTKAIVTNYSKSDFNLTYVNENELEKYNRVWDTIDLVENYPNGIDILTNMAITSNQTKGLCPDNPILQSVECDPKNNNCQKGFSTQNGVQTGNCIAADFPLGRHLELNNGSACEIQGWCPVDRMMVPLNDNKAVLIETKNISLHIYNTIEFPKEKIVINNIFKDPYWCSNMKTDPYCPTFKLGDIINRIPEVNYTFEDIAKFGAIIAIKIQWKCVLPLFSEFDCKPEYSFRRLDSWNNNTKLMYSLRASYDSTSFSRELIRSFRIRFQVQVEGSLKKYNLFVFITFTSAYTGVFSLMVWIFSNFVKYYFRNQINDDIINVSHIQESSNNNACDERTNLLETLP